MLSNEFDIKPDMAENEVHWHIYFMFADIYSSWVCIFSSKFSELLQNISCCSMYTHIIIWVEHT